MYTSVVHRLNIKGMCTATGSTKVH